MFCPPRGFQLKSRRAVFKLFRSGYLRQPLGVCRPPIPATGLPPPGEPPPTREFSIPAKARAFAPSCATRSEPRRSLSKPRLSLRYDVASSVTLLSSRFGLNFIKVAVYVLKVRLNSAIPVRFSADITARLKTVSENSGIPLSHLIRIATERYLETIESSRTVTIPLKGSPTPHKVKAKSVGKHS